MKIAEGERYDEIAERIDHSEDPEAEAAAAGMEIVYSMCSCEGFAHGLIDLMVSADERHFDASKIRSVGVSGTDPGHVLVYFFDKEIK